MRNEKIKNEKGARGIPFMVFYEVYNQHVCFVISFLANFVSFLLLFSYYSLTIALLFPYYYHTVPMAEVWLSHKGTI